MARILMRARPILERAGDDLLAERLHRILDEQGPAGLLVLAETVLPLLQSLAIALPQALDNETLPPVSTAAQTLGAVLHEREVSVTALTEEGTKIHAELLQDVVSGLRGGDHTLVAALLRISQAILTLERSVLLAYLEHAGQALTQPPFHDSASGLYNETYFRRRMAEEVQRARRLMRPLTLVLLESESDDPATWHALGRLVQEHIRGMDLAATLRNGQCAILLPETGREGAVTLIARLRRDVSTLDPHLTFRAGIAVSPDHGMSVDDLLTHAGHNLSGPFKHGADRAEPDRQQ